MYQYRKKIFTIKTDSGHQYSYQPPQTGFLESLYKATKPNSMKNISFYGVFHKKVVIPVLNSMKQQVQEASNPSLILERLFGFPHQTFERMKNQLNSVLSPHLEPSDENNNNNNNRPKLRIFENDDIIKDMVIACPAIWYDIGLTSQISAHSNLIHQSGTPLLSLLHLNCIFFIIILFTHHGIQKRISDIDAYCKIVIGCVNYFMGFNKNCVLNLFSNNKYKSISMSAWDSPDLIAIKKHIIAIRKHPLVTSFENNNNKSLNHKLVRAAVYEYRFSSLKPVFIETYGPLISDQLNIAMRAKYGKVIVQSAAATPQQLDRMRKMNESDIKQNKLPTKLIMSADIASTQQYIKDPDSTFFPMPLKLCNPRDIPIMKSLIHDQFKKAGEHLQSGGKLLFIGSKVAITSTQDDESQEEEKKESAEASDAYFYVARCPHTNSIGNEIEFATGQDPAEFQGWDSESARTILIHFQQEANQVILTKTKFGYINQLDIHPGIVPGYGEIVQRKSRRRRNNKIKFSKSRSQQLGKPRGWFFSSVALSNDIKKHPDLLNSCFAAELSSDYAQRGQYAAFYQGSIFFHYFPGDAVSINIGSIDASNDDTRFDASGAFEIFGNMDPFPKAVRVIEPDQNTPFIDCDGESYRRYSITFNLVKNTQTGEEYGLGISVFNRQRRDCMLATAKILYELKHSHLFKQQQAVKDQKTKPVISAALPPSIMDEDEDEDQDEDEDEKKMDQDVRSDDDQDEDEKKKMDQVRKQVISTTMLLRRKPIPNHGNLESLVSTTKKLVLEILGNNIDYKLRTKMKVEDQIGEFGNIRHKLYQKYPSYARKYPILIDNTLIVVIQMIHSNLLPCHYKPCHGLQFPPELLSQHSQKYHVNVAYQQIDEFRKRAYHHYYSDGKDKTQTPLAAEVREALQLENVFTITQWNHVIEVVQKEPPRYHIHFSRSIQAKLLYSA